MKTGNDTLKVNLGCGNKKIEGFLNIDVNPDFRPDMVLDLNILPYPFASNSVDHILAAQILEHLQIHCIDFLKEVYRILKPDGVIELYMPNMFSLPNRVRYLFGNIQQSPEWNPYHVKLVHPRYLLMLMRHIGFAPKVLHRNIPSFPLDYLFVGGISIAARKRR
jgi:predicted SAM-dependent methyltransferase